MQSLLRPAALRGAATRDALLDAAETLIADHGFTTPSHRMIAGQAGTHVALVNYHFGSKEMLFEAAVERRAARLNDAMDARRSRKCGPRRSWSVGDVLAAWWKPFAASRVRGRRAVDQLPVHVRAPGLRRRRRGVVPPLLRHRRPRIPPRARRGTARGGERGPRSGLPLRAEPVRGDPALPLRQDGRRVPAARLPRRRSRPRDALHRKRPARRRGMYAEGNDPRDPMTARRPRRRRHRA